MGLGTETDNARSILPTRMSSKRAHRASEAPILISQDDARQGPSEHHMLYFLGLASRARSCRICLFFIYSAMFYGSG